LTSVVLPLATVVFLVGEHVLNVNLSLGKSDDGDQPKLIATNVEDDEPPDPIRSAVSRLEIGVIPPVGSLDDRFPVSQRRLRLRMRFPKLPERLTRDDVHEPLTSLARLDSNFAISELKALLLRAVSG
jgi:hypothetical protein